MMTWLAVMFLAGLEATAPTADHSAEVMALAPAQADVFVYVDAEAMVQPSWAYLRTGLVKEPLLAGSPDLVAQIEGVMAEVDGELREIHEAIGLDPTADLDRGALWIELRSMDSATGKPDDLRLTAVVWGDFPTDVLAPLAAEAGWSSNIPPSGPTWYTVHGEGPAIYAVQLDKNTVLVGTEAEIAARVDGSHTAPTAAAGSALARQTKRLSKGAVAMVAVTPGKPLLALLERETGGSASARDLLTGFQHVQLALYADGLDLELDATSADLARRYAELAGGAADMIEASRVGARGLARVLLGALSEDDRVVMDPLKPMLRDVDATLALVERFTGGAALRVKDGSKLDDHRVTFEVRAGHLREIVVPATLAGLVMMEM